MANPEARGREKERRVQGTTPPTRQSYFRRVGLEKQAVGKAVPQKEPAAKGAVVKHGGPVPAQGIKPWRAGREARW